MDLPHLKMANTGNAKYRRRVTSAPMRAMLGKSAVEWSLKTRDPAKIVEAWRAANERFEALEVAAHGNSAPQSEWDIVMAAATAHGLVGSDVAKIGPINAEEERGRFKAFTEAILSEAQKLTPQQRNAKFVNNPPPNAAVLLTRAKIKGIERPPVPLSEAVKQYLKDREGRASINDLLWLPPVMQEPSDIIGV